MYIFKLHGKDYKVRFTYKMICKGDLLDKVTAMGDFTDLDAKGIINKLTVTTAELLLAGLQKYHKDEFGYDTEEERDARVDEMLDFFDDYEDESTEDHEQSAFTLFQDLQNELEKNGFLSAIQRTAEEATEQEQTAKKAMEQIENEPARVVAIKATESES